MAFQVGQVVRLVRPCAHNPEHKLNRVLGVRLTLTGRYPTNDHAYYRWKGRVLPEDAAAVNLKQRTGYSAHSEWYLTEEMLAPLALTDDMTELP